MKQFKWPAIALVLFVLIWVVLQFIEHRIEQKIKVVMEELQPNLFQVVDLGLWNRSLELTLTDSAVISLSDQKAVVHSGVLELKGLGLWSYWQNGDLKMNKAELNARFIEVEPTVNEQNSVVEPDSQKFAVIIGEILFHTDSLSFKGDQSIKTENVNAIFTDISTIDSLIYSIQSTEITALSHLDKKNRTWTVDRVHLGTQNLVLEGIKLEDKQPSNSKRLYINGGMDQLTLTWNGRFQEALRGQFESVEVRGIQIEMDEIDERDRCGGRRPCEKPLLSSFLRQLPIQEKVTAQGRMSYRFYKNETIAAEFDVDQMDMTMSYDSKGNPEERVDFHVDARFNQEIDVEWIGFFDGSDRFETKLKTQPFRLMAFNSLLPRPKGYSMAVERGKCSLLEFNFSGHQRTSHSELLFNYSDLSLDLKKDQSLGSRLLDWGSRTFINNNHDSEKPVTYTQTYGPQYSFFYYMGDHLNHSCRQVMIEKWAQQLL